MDTPPAHNVPTRGAIVVDANMIQEMSMELPTLPPVTPDSPIATLPHRTKTYLDVLPILASQGYHVIIPETAMLEATDLTGRGQDVFALFDSKPNYPQQGAARTFMQGVIAGNYPNIDIAKTDKRGPQAYQKYSAEIAKAFHRANPDAPDAVNRIGVRKAVMEVQRKFQDAKHDMGEHHCFDVIDGLIARNRAGEAQPPIFFLSTDGQSREDLHERIAHYHQESDPQVNVLTGGGIYLGLEKDTMEVGGTPTNALNQMGLSGTVEQHWEHIHKNRMSVNKKGIPKSASRVDGYEDSPLERYGTDVFPFEESAKGIGAAIAATHAQREAGTHAAAHPCVPPQDRIFTPSPDSGQSTPGRR